MGFVNLGQNITVAVTSGTTLTFEDETYDYRYNRLIVANAQSEEVNLTLNGATVSLAGTTAMDCPIYSLTVNDGGTVLVHGVKTVRELFGN